jgi:hypothetical protein
MVLIDLSERNKSPTIQSNLIACIVSKIEKRFRGFSGISFNNIDYNTSPDTFSGCQNQDSV